MRNASMSVHLVRGLRRGRRHQHRHRTLWLRVVRTREDVKRVEEVRFRVDEKLARRDDVLSQLEPIQNLRAATVLGADTHDGRAKVVGIIGDDHDASRAGLDHRLGRHGQHRFLYKRIKHLRSPPFGAADLNRTVALTWDSKWQTGVQSPTPEWRSRFK